MINHLIKPAVSVSGSNQLCYSEILDQKDLPHPKKISCNEQNKL